MLEQNLAKTLFIRLQQGHKLLLSLDLPAESVRLLSKILPDRIKELLKLAGTDLEELERQYQKQPITEGSVLVSRLGNADGTLVVYLA